MSFLSVLHGINSAISGVASVEAKIDPIVRVIPVFGPYASVLFKTITVLEELRSPTTKGVDLKPVAISLINVIHPGIDQTKLAAHIDEAINVVKQVEAFLAKIDGTGATK